MSSLKGEKSAEIIPLSPRKTPNELKDSKLGDFCLNTGTQPGQYQYSLYSTLKELCKEKKMSYSKPRAYIDYTLPKLTQGKEWYVHYSVKDPSTEKFKRFKVKVNRWKTIKEKKAAASAIIAQLTEQLALGWNPLIEKLAPKSYTKMSEALDMFLKVTTKELEANSMRSYNSYVKALKLWLKAEGYREGMFIAQFDKNVARKYIDSIELKKNITACTYNNYLSFLRLLFNWFVSRGYISANPFQDIKKKPKRLIKKTRRIFTNEEINTMISYLEKENKEYLAMCLLCYCCFLRPKELALLKCKDIDLHKQAVYVSSDIAKNDNSSIRTIPDAIIPYLEILNLKNRDWFLFGDNPKSFDFKASSKCIYSRKIAKYWELHVRPDCNFSKDLQFYSLKDTGITQMIGGGVPISFVQQQADHSSIAMTAIYLNKNNNQVNNRIKEVDLVPTQRDQNLFHS